MLTSGILVDARREARRLAVNQASTMVFKKLGRRARRDLEGSRVLWVECLLQRPVSPKVERHTGLVTGVQQKFHVW